MTARFFSVRSTDIAHDSIDGESVIIDMARGIYYRMDGAAALAWQAVQDGAGTDAIATALASRFGLDPATAAAEVDRFVDELSENDLLRPADPRPDTGLALAPGASTPFSGLVIHRFTDLQELFALDPVHQVDQTGWPHRALTGD